MNRRDWLLRAGTAAVSPLLPAMDAGLIAKAKKNLPLGVFTNVYSRFPVAEAARRIRTDGFSGAVLEFKFSDVTFNPLAPDWTVAHTIVQAFDNAGVRIVALAGYYNIVDPDTARRKRGEDRMRALLSGWKRLGSPVVCTETGTLNRNSEWLEWPENQTEQTYAQCRSILTELSKLAQSNGATLAIEPYWRNVIGTAEVAERLFNDVGAPSLKLVMDPCNYYREADLPRMKPMLEEIFRRVGSQAVIAHAKDVKPAVNGPDLPASGLGLLDYPLYLSLLARLDRPMHLVIEHLELEDVPRAKAYVLQQFEKIA